MTARPQELDARVSSLEARLRRVEDHLKIAGEPESTSAKGAVRGESAGGAPVPCPPPLPPAIPTVPPASTLDSPRQMPTLVALGGASADAVPAQQPPPQSPHSGSPWRDFKPTTTSFSSWDIESLIGGRWYAIAGALAVVLGIVLFLKLGFDRGWFDMAPAVKCGLAAFFGCLLIGCGEVLRRRVSSAAATGAYAAGLGVVYASAYAAFRLYGLLPDTLAFALLGFTAIAGITISAAANLPIVAIVSLLGGYLAPFLFADAPARPLVLPAYLIMLLLIGLGICALRGRSFSHVRSIVRVATLLLGAVWFFQQGREVPIVAIGFSAIVWIACHVELIWSSVRRSIEAQPLRSWQDQLTLEHWHQWSPLASTFSLTAWSCVLGVLALREGGQADWLAPAAYLVATAGLGSFLAGHLDCFRQVPGNTQERIGAMMHAQAAALLLVTIALVLGGWAQITAWLIMATAAACTGNLLRSRVFHLYALAPLLICTGRLLAYDLSWGDMSADRTVWWGLEVSIWTILMCIAGAAWCVNAIVLLRYGGGRTSQATGAWASTSDVASCVGISLAGIALASAAPTEWARGWVFLSCAAACWIWSAFLGRRRLGAMSEVGTLGTILPALASVWWDHRSNSVSIAGLYLTPYALLPLCIAFMLAGRAVTRARSRTQPGLANILLVAGMFVLTFAAVHTRASVPSVLVIWSGIAIAAAALRASTLRFQPMFGIVAIMLLSMGVWSIRAMGDTWSPGVFVAGLIMSATLGLIPTVLSLREPLEQQEAVRRAFAGVSALLLLINTSLQVAQMASNLLDDQTIRAAAISVWWGLFALGLIMLGFFRRLPLLRHAGLGLLAIAAAKGLIVDLWAASAIWRIMSLVLLGLMMIGVAAGYQKIIRSLAERHPSDGPAAN